MTPPAKQIVLPIVAFVGISLIAGTVAAGTASNLQDLDCCGPVGSQPPFVSKAVPEYVRIGALTYFTASTPGMGRELWKSDGTGAGTAFVRNIFPGNASSDPRELTNFNGTLYFVADDGRHGRELWKSDGTLAGTVLVKDVFPEAEWGDPRHLTVMNGILYFTARDPSNGYELWRSDGSGAGTRRVTEIDPYLGPRDPEYSFTPGPRHLVNASGVLYFQATDGTDRRRYGLYRSDGTPEGTVRVSPADFWEWASRDAPVEEQVSTT